MVQTTDAAERSAHVTRGGQDELEVDGRTFYWVVLRSPTDGSVWRHWHTRATHIPSTLVLEVHTRENFTPPKESK